MIITNIYQNFSVLFDISVLSNINKKVSIEERNKQIASLLNFIITTSTK